jgi:succinyl-diaminopimelate desuccinylase
MMDESNIESTLRPLVEVNTSNPPGRNYRKIAIIIKQQLLPIGCEIKLVKTPEERVKALASEVEGTSGERINLVATLKRGKGKTILLNAHSDVVPVGTGWTYSPFALTKDEGRFYGRGVSDDKGPLAVFILVLKELAVNPDWKGSIQLAVTVDEEIGGYTGLSCMLDEGIVAADYCIVSDGVITGITNASNGGLQFRVVLHGKSVHSSMNWRGINAIEKASKLIARLEKYNKLLYTSARALKCKIRVNPESGVNYLTPSISVGVVQGGIKVNIIPDRCVVEIDRRVIPEEKKSDAVKEFKEILEALKREDAEFSYELVVRGPYNSWQTPENHELVTTMSQVYEKVTKSPAPVRGALGCLDACYAAEHQIPVVNFGVGPARARLRCRSDVS